MDGSTGRKAEGGAIVLATYREIAERFRLRSGPNAGRMKAKRSGWPPEPPNHPLDTIRVRVPREAWDAASPARSARAKPVASAERVAAVKPDPIAELRAIMARVEETQAEALREAQALADRRGDDLAALRERLGRAEAERDLAEQRARDVAADRDLVAQQLEAIRAELVAWRGEGPFSRAIRAFFWKRAAE
jgi:hypothetical protein